MSFYQLKKAVVFEMAFVKFWKEKYNRVRDLQSYRQIFLDQLAWNSAWDEVYNSGTSPNTGETVSDESLLAVMGYKVKRTSYVL